MNIFLTGASGFIGGAIAAKLRGGHRLLALSRSEKSDASIATLGAVPLRGQLGAIRPDDLRGIDVVIHCAAYVQQYGPREAFQQVTIEGTRQLLEAARAAGVRRFLHVSSEAALFVGQDMIDIDEEYPYPQRQRFLYSWSKAEAEKLVRAANEDGVFETICLRPRLVWGPGDQTVLPALVDMVRKGSFAWMDGGRARTSVTHIYNFVHAIELALQRGKGGSVYFITDDESMTFREFLTRLMATRGVQAPQRSMPSWLARASAAALESIYALRGAAAAPPLTRFAAAIMSASCTIRIDRARRELGYAPVLSVEQGLKLLAEEQAA
ncbi:MAG: NAD-dependent epimerase/dehydratase family protein [Leptospirales bacterium]|nr:NAD-dependent epimerase/dehydratase family protein [Leptospirales bacterium]